MPTLYLADVRKRANADFSRTPQAVPEERSFPDELDPASPDGQQFQQLLKAFGSPDQDSPDAPVPCPLPGADNITMEWSADESAGQIDFYAPAPGQQEPQRFLSLYLFSGLNPAEDRAAMKRLETYADLSLCQNFPLVVRVTDTPLPAWQQQPLQSLRQAVATLAAAFLKAHLGAQNVDRV